MRYFIDSEFIDDGKTIDLISIGIVCEDGKELYLQSADFDPGMASQWVKDNVIDHLKICPHGSPEFTKDPYTNRMLHGGWKGQCTFERWSEETGVYTGAYEDCFWRTRLQIMHEVKVFFNPSDGFELWGWCAGYDFVAFCQLFGTMMDLPQGWPHYIRDIQYILDERGIADEQLPRQEAGPRNALADARHIKKLWEWLHEHKSA